MDSLIAYVLPVGCVVAVWWLGTSAILRLDRLPSRTFPVSLAAGGLFALAGVVAIAESAPHATPLGAYAGFLGALALWGWIELTFLTGLVVGPRRTPCPPARGLTRFGFAVQAVLYHELALLGAAGVVVVATWGGQNKVALWTFGVLWVMRACAKLNLHFGVPNLGEELLPPRLRYLGSYFSRGPVTPFFPATVGLAALVAMPLWKSAVAHGAMGFAGIESAIVATLLTLAIAEHIFMVLPIPQTALWAWGGGGAADSGAGGESTGKGNPS